MMTKLKVRCCCVPTKVYGTMQLAESVAKPGYLLRIPLLTIDADIEYIELEVAKFWPGGILSHYVELALKYEGDEPFEIKLERLRGVPEFTEGVEFE